MEWLDSIYSDGTKEYVSNPIPFLGEEIAIQLRIFEDAPVDCIFLRYKKDGLEYLEEMKKTISEKGLQYYECEVKVESRTFSYHFYIVSGEKIFYYNQKGVFEAVPDEIYDFKILAEYQQADWLKGRVFYQIFPDRFCKGRKSGE